MILDLSTLAHLHDFQFETESLGTIQCISLTTGMLIDIEKELKTDDSDGPTFARKLIGKVGQRLDEEPTKEGEHVSDVSAYGTALMFS